MYHSLPDKSRMKAAAVLGVHHFFMTEYEVAAANYSAAKAAGVIGLLRKYDLKSKGVDRGSATESELLKELVFKILH